MGRPLAVVAAALTVFAGVNFVVSATRALSATETAPSTTVAATVPTSALGTPPPPSPPPPATAPAPPNTPTLLPASTPETPSTPPPDAPTVAADATAPLGPPPRVFDSIAALPDAEAPPAFAAAAVISRGIGCTAEPFAEAFARSGFTPAEVNVGSCEIVLDIPGRVPTDQVCAQVSGPPAARAIHVAQRTIEGECRRDPLGVTIHEIGHAWHLADPARYYRVLASFGLDPRADASLEVVAECFVEAVGYLDTDCGPQGASYVRGEMDASRAGR